MKNVKHILNKFCTYAFLFGFILTSCKKEKTFWNSNWSFPLVSDTLSLENLVNDSTLSVNPSGFLEVDLSRTVLDIGIEDILELPDTLIVHSFVSTVPSINVPAGFTIVNEIEEHELDFKGVQLKKIRISNGKIGLRVYNPLPTKTFFTLKLPGVTKNGNTFEQNYIAPASSTSQPGLIEAEANISGYDIDLTGLDGSNFNMLQSLLIVSSDPSGPSITVTNSQIFKVEANFTNLQMDYARGYFGEKVIQDTSEFVLDALLSLTNGSLDLPSPKLSIEVINGVKVEARAALISLENTNWSGNTVQLIAPQIGTPIYIDGATGSWSSIQSSTESIHFDGSNSNIEGYLENIGSSHRIIYKIELNPWGNTSGGWNELFPNSRLKVKVNAQMPLSIGADGLTLADTFDLNLKQDLEKTHIESGSFVLNAANTFPFNASTELHLINEQGEELFIIQSQNKIVSSVFGILELSTGLMKKDSEVIFELTPDILLNLDEVKKVMVRAVFDTPNGNGTGNQQMSFPNGAYMAVKLKTHFKLKTIY